MLVFLRFDCEAWSKVCQFNWKCAKIDMEMTFSFLKIQGKTCQLKHLHRNELEVFNYEVIFFFFSKFWALKSSSQYILSFKDFLFAIFDRELMTKSLLKYFLKEGVSLQPLSWMWGLVWIAILLCYCQLRYELFQCLFSSD